MKRDAVHPTIPGDSPALRADPPADDAVARMLTRDAWRSDPRAPRWLNRAEARLAGHSTPASRSTP